MNTANSQGHRRSISVEAVRLLKRLFCLRNLLILGTLLVFLWAVAEQSGSMMDFLIAQELRLREAQQSHPWSMFAAAFALYFVACYLPGTNGKSFLIGWLFGPLLGAMLINIGSTLAAVGMFATSRCVLQGVITNRYSGQLQLINDHLGAQGAVYLVVLRMIPVIPYSLLNILLGATSIRGSAFWWTTQLGMLPLNFGFAWFGASLPELRDLREVGLSELWNADLFSAIAFLCALLLFVRWVAAQWKPERQQIGR